MTFLKGNIPFNKGKTKIDFPQMSNSGAKKGIPSWNKGIPMLEKSKQKIRGEYNAAWKGNNVGYQGLHKWIRTILGNATHCANGHEAKRYVWANVSGEYKRDLEDWQQLCDSCNFADGITIPNRFKERRVLTLQV
jgi:hypothetical protein